MEPGRNAICDFAIESCRRRFGRWCLSSPFVAGTFALAAIASFPSTLRADEGGVGFWLPGLFGSLAAAPQVPGWSYAMLNVYESERASGAVAAAREFTINRGSLPVNLNLDLSARADLVLFAPTYVFATPVLGGSSRSVSREPPVVRAPT